MKKLSILLSINLFILLTGCASTCMEYRSATTAARSEKDLKRAEEWGLKALDTPECNPDTNAWIPYFLAKEVYMQQRSYKEMAKMLDRAEKRNSNQPLENPFKMGDTSVETIGEGVNALREQEWLKIYNKAIRLNETGKLEKAKKWIEVAMLIHPSRMESYSTLAFWYMETNDKEMAINTIDRGLDVDDESSVLYQLKADILLQNNPDINKMESAKELYLIAINYSDDSASIMRKLLFVYIDMGDNQKAIDYSNELLDKYPNDSDLYYNVGVLYQRLTLELFDPTRGLFLKTTDESSPEKIREVYDSFKTARKYAYNSKDFFLQASDLELDENLFTRDAVSEMDKLMDQIDGLFIPSIRETAKSAGIKLD